MAPSKNRPKGDRPLVESPSVKKVDSKEERIEADKPFDETQGKPLDVSSLIKGYEEKPIVPASVETTMGKSTEERPVTPVQQPMQEVPLEERLKEDLKMSYPAKGILDITFGGYGFLRQNYVLSPDKDIYVSTSQIRRFWLRRGDEVEGLARPPKQGERFHSLLLIKKINGVELTEQDSAKRKS